MYSHRIHLRRATALALAAFAALPPGALAQSSTVPGLEPGTEKIEVRARPIPAVPGAAGATVTAAETKEVMPKDVGELLAATVPGVTGQRYAGSHVDPVVRGLRADRITVSIDGTRLWGADPFRMDPVTSLIDPEEIETIEVVKGPYSVTHGPTGVGATVNVTTKAPRVSDTLDLGGEASSGYTGSFDGWNAHGAVWTGGPTVAARLAGGYRDYGNYESGNGEEVPSGYENRSLAGKVLWQPTPDDRLRLDLNVDSDRDMQYASTMMNAKEDDAASGALSYARNRPLPGIDDLQVTGYYTYVHHHMTTDGKPSAATMPMDFPLNSRTGGGRLQLNLPVLDKGRLALGADGYLLERAGTRYMTMKHGMMTMTTATKVFDGAHVGDAGVFGELTYPLGSQVRGIAGARLDVVSAGAGFDAAARAAFAKYYGAGAADDSQTEVNPSANARLIYSPVETLDLFAAVGRGVRTADVTERFYVMSPGRGGYLIGNPSLDPERSLEVDLGATSRWHRLTLNGSVFHNRVEDYIQQVKLANADVNMDGMPDTITGFRNLALATLTGVDLGASYSVTRRLSASASLAWVHGENQDADQPLPEIPPLEGTVGLRYERGRHGAWHAWAHPSVRLVRRQDRIDSSFGENETPGFATVDLRAGLRLRERYELALNAMNLLDKNYNEHLTRPNPFTGAEVPEPGRMIGVTVRASF